jgi:4-amino-4-deoxy-L-arabinose transferase-like glycosyltransferase
MSAPSRSVPDRIVSPLSTRDARNHVVLFLLILLASALFFLGLGTPGLFDADEPAYAGAAREMLERGDWVTPYFNGQPRFDKPVLFYWLILLTYRVFGITEFAVRFWSALAGVGLVVLLWRAARRRMGDAAALWTGVAFSTNLLTALLARAAVTDMLLTFFVTAAILAGLAAVEQPDSTSRWAARGMWAAMALAALVKGPVGLVIPAMALGGCLLTLREVRTGLRRLVPWEGLALFLLIAAPWYVLALSANGWAFIEGFVIKHHVTRYTGVISSHAGPLWFYFPVVLVGFFPWSGFLPAALWRAAGTVRRRRAEAAGDHLVVTCLCWLTGLFIFFSLAGTKLPSYLFPVFPAMALLVGSAIAISNAKPTTDNRATAAPIDRFSVLGCQLSIAAERSVPRWVTGLTPWLIGVTGGALAVGLFLLPLIFDRVRPAARGVLDGVAPPTGIGWGLAALLLVGITAALAAKGHWRPILLAVTMCGFILTAALAVAPMAYGIAQGSLREFSEEAGRIVQPGDPVLVYGLNAPSVVFYANRRVRPIGAGAPGEVEAAVRAMRASGRSAALITRSGLMPQLKDIPGLALRKSVGGYALYVSSP